MTIRRLNGLKRDRRGATIIEFALILPVMLVLMMGLTEIAYQAYIQSILDGAIQKAGRDSGVQGGAANSNTIDLQVMNVIWQAAGRATWSSTRKSYAKFGYVKGEPFTDSNGNGKRDINECFADVNGNGKYDSDISSSGQGGANDVTVYTMTIQYPRLFPLAKMLGWAPQATLSAMTILKNQPYQSQNTPTETTMGCPGSGI
jgi:Flp pilus assembly protein TadG